MRYAVALMLGLFTLALGGCAIAANRSRKPLSRDVFHLLVALIPPMLGNLLIIASSDWLVARIGCYTYYIGLDITVYVLLLFSVDYCNIEFRGTLADKVVRAVIAFDVVQLLVNNVTGHAFDTHEILVDGAAYHMLVPFIGQAFHRIAAYGVFFASLIVFIYSLVTSSRIYFERYGVILATMLAVGGWETFYIFSRSPIDRAMLGFGFFGLCVFYFALFFKPTHLLDRLLSRVVSEMRESMLLFDRDHQCIYANAQAEQLLHLTGSRNLTQAGPRVARLLGTDKLDLAGDEWTRQLSVGAGDDLRHYRVDFRRVSDERGREVGSSLSVYDRTEEEANLQREKYAATHDRLTGLYNTEHLYEEIRRTIDKNPDTSYMVGALDIKDFKLVNDVFSRDFGDTVLLSVAEFMHEFATIGAVYGRMSGDRFGFLAPAEAIDPEAIGKRLSGRVVLDEETGVEHPIVQHLGLYPVTEPDLPVSIMFDRAFMAITSIKNDYQRHVAFYDDEMRDTVLWNQRISSELDDAIATGQIVPYLQPMVSSEGRIEGAEVLVRWIHPEEGFLPPFKFIPCFEENGMIARLDAHMWECACQILREWQDRGINMFLSVNISPKDFYFLDVEGTIRGLVEKYGIEPRRLRLEITETVMMSDLENRLRIIQSLRSAGFLLEMDDFGSGYSSLNMLKDMPVDVLKIDMMFLYKTKDQRRAQTILQSIINLSQDLGMPSVTEGVETVEQRDMLIDMGCHLFQGYYFAKPMPRAEFEQYCNLAA